MGRGWRREREGTSSHLAGVWEEEEGRLFAGHLKEKAKEKVWFPPLDLLSALAPSSWIYLEA